MLTKSSSKQAFSHNVSVERHAGKPLKQALAIAYSVQRRASHHSGASMHSSTLAAHKARHGIK
jgi:hypothetical protein